MVSRDSLSGMLEISMFPIIFISSEIKFTSFLLFLIMMLFFLK